MAFDVEAAKADGYTDEEIQQYLATKDQAIPEEKPIDRQDEKIGVMTSVVPDAVKYGLEGAGLYAGGKALANAFRGPGAGAMAAPPVAVPPPPPITPAQQTFNALKATDAENFARTTQQPSVVQRGINYAQQMQKIAAEKVMAGARAAGPAVASMGRAAAPFAAPAAVGLGAMTYSGGLNTNEQQELARRRAMMPNYTGQ